LKLTIASRGGKEPGFTGIDSIKTEHVDIVWDLEVYPWPIQDNSVEEISCIHQFVMAKDLIKFMAELYRISKPEAGIKFICPYYTSIKAISNPEIQRQVSEATFMFFDSDFRKENKLTPYMFNFKPIQSGLSWIEPWGRKSEENKEFSKTHYWNVVEDIIILTKVIK
jgi:ubiquinone/menaquinone biosynthesis C-methylase UbiE